MGRSLPDGGDGWGHFLDGGGGGRHVPREERRALGELVEATVPGEVWTWKKGIKMCMSMGRWLPGALEAREST